MLSTFLVTVAAGVMVHVICNGWISISNDDSQVVIVNL